MDTALDGEGQGDGGCYGSNQHTLLGGGNISQVKGLRGGRRESAVTDSVGIKGSGVCFPPKVDMLIFLTLQEYLRLQKNACSSLQSMNFLKLNHSLEPTAREDYFSPPRSLLCQLQLQPILRGQWLFLFILHT